MGKEKRGEIRVIANTKDQARKLILSKPYGKDIAISTLRKLGEVEYGNVYIARVRGR